MSFYKNETKHNANVCWGICGKLRQLVWLTNSLICSFYNCLLRVMRQKMVPTKAEWYLQRNYSSTRFCPVSVLKEPYVEAFYCLALNEIIKQLYKASEYTMFLQ